MSDWWYQILSLDVPAVLTALCCGLTCALLGNFLVLRRLSLMGDAISHSVLPGIVIAFLISGSRNSLGVFLGAAVAGILTAVLVELVRKLGRVETGAAMGVIFSILFALGVLLIEQAAARSVDLDADCLLHGQLESIFWFPPRAAGELFAWETLLLFPEDALISVAVFFITASFVYIFFKELTLSAFDSALGNSLGFNSNLLHYLLMVFVAIAVVASFEAVGSILVIAMLICPAAIARLLTDRLGRQVRLSLLLSASATILGYYCAAFLPLKLGWESSVNAAGMMTVILGCFLFAAVVFAPMYGILGKQYRSFVLSLQMVREDFLGILFRAEEVSPSHRLTRAELFEAIRDGVVTRIAYRQSIKRGYFVESEEGLALSNHGRRKAQKVIKRHRLWESYLVEGLGLRSDHVHDKAMQLEHFTDDKMSEQLKEKLSDAEVDPHGKPIPDSTTVESG